MIAIAAMSRNRVIGKDGKLPWHLPADLKFFKRTTLGHAIVMGRKTFESIGRALPGRTNIVLTRGKSGWHPPDDVLAIHGIDEMDALVPPGQNVFLIGGGSLYEELLPSCREMYLTLLDGEVDGDTFFPDFDLFFPKYQVIEQGEGYEIRHYTRSSPGGVSEACLR
jgi:dihydrofolate reductase